jgi:hypothetical protein
VEKSFLLRYLSSRIQFPRYLHLATMAANINAVDNTLPAEVAFNDMLGRIELNVHARDKFRQVFDYRTGNEFIQMEVHKKAMM